MSERTTIEWTDRTWNPVRGCSRVSEGCRNCYAERQAARYSGPGQAFDGFAHSGSAGPRWTGEVALLPHKLAEPLSWRKPQRVFVNSMSDLFHGRLRNEEIAAVFGVMAACRLLTFQVLTKRPERMREWFEWLERQRGKRFLWPMLIEHAACVAGNSDRLFAAANKSAGIDTWPLPNVWLGVSVEDQATADERIPLLLQTPSAVRFVSYEPALGPVDFQHWLWATAPSTAGPWTLPSGRTIRSGGVGGQQLRAVPARELQWLIVGGESGPGARPFDVDWARSTVQQCREAGVPCFVKQVGSRPCWGKYGPESGSAMCARAAGGVTDAKGADPSEWPEDLRVREFPESPGVAS